MIGDHRERYFLPFFCCCFVLTLVNIVHIYKLTVLHVVLSKHSIVLTFLKRLQVVLPFGLHKDVDAHLRAHLSQKPMNRGNLSHNSMSRSNGNGSIAKDGGLYEQEEPLIQNSVAMERILQQRSLRLRNKQQEWQVIALPFCHSCANWKSSPFAFW